jgi:hypothetical protein
LIQEIRVITVGIYKVKKSGDFLPISSDFDD